MAQMPNSNLLTLIPKVLYCRDVNTEQSSVQKVTLICLSFHFISLPQGKTYIKIYCMGLSKCLLVCVGYDEGIT